MEQSAIINLDGIPEQRARQPGTSKESASSHIKKEISYWVDAGDDASPKLDYDSDSTSAEMQNTPVTLGNIDPSPDILSTGNNGAIAKVLQAGGSHVNHSSVFPHSDLTLTACPPDARPPYRRVYFPLLRGQK